LVRSGVLSDNLEFPREICAIDPKHIMLDIRQMNLIFDEHEIRPMLVEWNIHEIG
jgi:hypothetical protein